MNIVVIGNGRAGSRWARLAREIGHTVWCSDINPARCDSGVAPKTTDAVIVATPAELHFAAAWQAHQLWPDVRMMVEKPLDTNLDHETEWRKMNPAYVAQWRAHRMFRTWCARRAESPWIRLVYTRTRPGVDPLMESAIHDIDLARLIVGEVTPMMGNHTDDRTGLIIGLHGESGQMVTIVTDHAPTASLVRRRWIESEGCIVKDDGGDPDAAYRLYLAAFLEDSKSVATVDDGLAALRIALQVREGMRVQLH